MATPLWDALSVEHSKNIRDAVASATTNGYAFSYLQREYHLNSALRRWQKMKYQLRDWSAIRPYINNYSGTLDASTTIAVASFTGGLAFIQKFLVTDGTSWYTALELPPQFRNLGKASLVNANGYLKPTATEPRYIYEGSTIQVVPETTFASKAILVDYVKQLTDITSGGATDIAIDNTYYTEVLNIAKEIAMLERPNQENVAIAQAAIGEAMNEMKIM